MKITSASGTSSADLRGPTGPIGIKGNPGDAGKSAYEYARDSGYMGSEAKFSEQLAGIPDWDKVKTYTANTNIVIAQQSLSSGMWMNRKQDIEPGIPYAVYIGGKEYFCIAGNEDGTIYLGNPKLFDSASTQAHNNEPFCITWAGGSATAGMFFKDSTLSYPITLKVTGAAVTTENKLPEKYLPDGVAMKSDIPEGGGANIDVVASVGQTIVVEEVDAEGKPTKWEAVEYPVGAKIYSRGEIESMTYAEFREEYYKHPVILRLDSVGGSDWHTDILLTCCGDSMGGCGFSRRYKEAIHVYSTTNVNGKISLDVRRYYIPAIDYANSETGFLYQQSSGTFYIKQISTKPATATVPAEYLVDGATLPIPYSEFATMLEAFNEHLLMVIMTEIDGKQITIPVLFTSTDVQTYATTVKCISPTTGELITVTLVLNM